MATLTSPLRFAPLLKPTVWGGRKLHTILGKPLPPEGTFGESWELSHHAHHDSVVAAGPFAGCTLGSLMADHRADLFGTADQYTTFPWLVKFLDVEQLLSVQVHPDDAKARLLCPGDGGKTEAWFVIDAAPTSKIYAGLKPGTTAESLLNALDNNRVDEVLHSFTPVAGQCIFVPAGMVHASGGGILMAEIQQTSDATFRLFDWNRLDAHGKPRELHRDLSLQAIDWNMHEPETVLESDFVAPTGAGRVRTLVRSPFFRLTYFRWPTPFPLGGDGHMQVLMVLAGQGHVAGETVHAGETWLLPAAMPRATVTPEPTITGLLCNLP